MADPDEKLDSRRPLASRNWAVFIRFAAYLARIGVPPNVISVTCILFAALAGGAFWGTGRLETGLGERALWIAAAACLQLRLIANLLDGMVAVEGGRRTPTGELYNEAPDRVADALAMLGAGFASGADPALGALAAIVSLFVAYVRALGASVGVGHVFHGPMAKQHRMAVLTAAALWCAFAPVAWRGTFFNQHGPMSVALAVIVVGGVVTAVRRLRIIAGRLRDRWVEPQ